MTDQLKLTLSSGVVHGLKCRVKGRDEILTIIGYDNHLNSVRVKIGEYAFYTRVDDIELLMHPISRLTEPILPDGKIPIVELAKECWFKIFNYEIENFERFETFSEDEKYGLLAYFENQRIGFSFINDCGFSYFDFSVDGDMLMTNQFSLFDQLDAWHINYRGVEAVEI